MSITLKGYGEISEERQAKLHAAFEEQTEYGDFYDWVDRLTEDEIDAILAK